MLNLNQIATNLISLVVFFILLFGFTKILGPIPFDITQVTTSKSDAFSVTGEGKVEVKPDSAIVRLGVVARAKTEEAAKNLLNTNINKVISSIKALGVAEDKIKTENFSIYPEYSNVRPVPAGAEPVDQNTISGYTGSTNLSVTVDTAGLANRIIDAGVSSGANQVGGVDFQVKDKTAALNQAREMAVKDARKKAEDAARIAGFKLGKIINYSEGQNGDYPRPLAMAADKAQGGSVPTEVQAGTNEIAVTVTLSYEIR
ncbi:MAG TPA: SIMPL domain-containing protein [Patescibacteria group bacterium]|nr:SIMPL domain-containing protein [Patescibacteria group bacterium]